LIERGQIANPITLKPLFDQDEALKDRGGAQYLARLAEAVISVVDADDYGRTVHDLYLRRQLIAVGEAMVNEAYKIALDVPATQQIEASEKALFDLATTDQVDKGAQTFGQALSVAVQLTEQAYKHDGKFVGIESGLADLDRLLGGFHPSDLLILAGRPSMGKTSLATNMAFQAALDYQETKHKKKPKGAVVAFFSLEMSAEQLAARILAERTEIPSERLRRGDLQPEEMERIMQVSHQLSDLPLFIDDTPAISVSSLRTRARRLKRQFNLGMIVVDYLQLMSGPVGSRNDSRVQEISDITRGLKAIAKELAVPVIALSQLSRAVENREDKRPQLSDLRESGSIEQDADVVMFVFREEYYLERKEPTRMSSHSEEKFNEEYERWHQQLAQAANVAEVIIAKQRHGPIGKVKVRFDGATTKFSNLMADME
jgi:replicative DNA helicase